MIFFYFIYKKWWKKNIKKENCTHFSYKIYDFYRSAAPQSTYLSTYQSRVYGKAVDATNFFFGLKGFYFLGEIKKQEKSVG